MTEKPEAKTAPQSRKKLLFFNDFKKDEMFRLYGSSDAHL